MRSLCWVALLPGGVAGYVPWRYFGLRQARWDHLGPNQIIGLVGIVAGALLELACVWEFARSGRGTLSVVDPPRELVVRGLYRYVRNPMYLSVSLILLGEALAIGSKGLFLYWAVFFILANGFVMLYEEPNLRRRFGVSYDRYLSSVGRWIPRLPGRGA